YAPLANRLGMGKLKAEFETLAFPLAYPKEYALTSRILKTKEKHATERLEKIYRALRQDFAMEKLPIIKSDYRLKNIYSLYRKLLRYDMDITKIHDLIALRLVTDTVENCYRALGIIHGKYKPLAGKVKDYIANPKPNGYRSIHTTIYTGDQSKGADGGTAEVQIRTKEMHDEAEYGVTAHVAYTEGGKSKSGGEWSNKLAWVRELVALAKEAKSTNEFAEAVKLDFFKNQIFVFTPDGDVIELPDEATPVDFAYAIHTTLGDHAHAAKVNGKYTGLDTTLRGGETIFIETKKESRPSSKWLDFAKSTMARKKIRAYLSRKK
ncbi:MAG TPA: TGS domain-containing protein, partial [Candidatus Paceibacterota bacterium]